MSKFEPDKKTLLWAEKILQKREIETNRSYTQDDTYYFARELTAVKTRIIEHVYGPEKAIALVPEESEVTPATAEKIEHELFEIFGQSEVITNWGDDPPVIEMSFDKFDRPVLTIACAYTYTLQDIWSAEHTGFSKLAKKSEGCLRSNMRKSDEIFAVGYAPANVPGLVNDPDVQIITLPTGDWTNPATTGDEVLRDLLHMEETIITNSGENFYPDTLLIPGVLRAKLNSPHQQGSDTTTWDIFTSRSSWGAQKQSVEWTLDTWSTLEGAGAGGVDRIVMYKADQEVLEGSIPLVHDELEPQMVNLQTKVPCIARVVGTVIKHPLGLGYSDNANA